MGRRLHLIFAAATVLLVAAWLLSGRWIAQTTVGPRSYAFVTVYSGRVSLGFEEMNQSHRDRWVTGWLYDMIGASRYHYRLKWLPEGQWRRQRSAGATTWRKTSLAIPLWMPAMLTAVATPLLWRRHRQRLRERSGACLACGYNLRGLAASAEGAVVCPECGKAVDSAECTVKSAP